MYAITQICRRCRNKKVQCLRCGHWYCRACVGHCLKHVD